MSYAENDQDIANVEAWAQVIEDLLHLMPYSKRAEVLAHVAKNEEVRRKEMEDSHRSPVGNCCLFSTPHRRRAGDYVGLCEPSNSDGFVVFAAADIDLPDPTIWHTTMRLQSLAAQVFVRRITNNHSAHKMQRKSCLPCTPTATGPGACWIISIAP
jgi:hypothetical protein